LTDAPDSIGVCVTSVRFSNCLLPVNVTPTGSLIVSLQVYIELTRRIDSGRRHPFSVEKKTVGELLAKYRVLLHALSAKLAPLTFQCIC
jgi:hypothetical protein